MPGYINSSDLLVNGERQCVSVLGVRKRFTFALSQGNLGLIGFWKVPTCQAVLRMFLGLGAWETIGKLQDTRYKKLYSHTTWGR